MSDVSLTGGCLCGAVRFRYAGPLGGPVGAVTVCHCAQCRKAQGYAAAVAPAVAAGFQITAGTSDIREFQSSPGKFRAFCGGCGSPLYSRLAASPERLRLRLGGLDDPPDTLTSTPTPSPTASRSGPFPARPRHAIPAANRGEVRR